MSIQQYNKPVLYYVGKGNNSNLIRSLMKKRFWFQQTTNEKQANFIWTQIKLPFIFHKQKQSIQKQQNQNDRKSPNKNNLGKHDSLSRILNNEQLRQFISYQQNYKSKKINNFQDKLKLSPRKIIKQNINYEEIIHNHMPSNGLLGNKKAMFLCLKHYCQVKALNVFDIVPLTFIVSNGLLDPQYNKVAALYNQRRQKKLPNFWIIKPGQFSNRGNGIQCTNKLQEIRKRVGRGNKERKKVSLIIQQYLVRPLLYNGRKFDIRAYMAITWHNNKMKAYWYQEGYVRTSSDFFNLQEMRDPMIHLTNDAVQKHSQNYGKFQDGNKLSYPQLQRYLDSLPTMGRNLDFYGVLLPKMKQIAGLTVRSAFLGLNRQKKQRNFQVFGLDFMIDQKFKPWLIEVNTNPCLQLSSGVLQRLIPHMIQNLLRIGLDTQFPPPDNFSNNFKYNIPQNSLHYNKFQIIFDSDREGEQIRNLYQNSNIFNDLQGLEQDKNQFISQGQMINIDQI